MAKEKDSFVPQAKMMRLLTLMQSLSKRKLTIEEMRDLLDVDERTVYRYLHILEELDYGIEQNFEKRWFIVESTCPLCGGELHHG